MKISNSHKQLAKIISENGGWREGAEWAVFGTKSMHVGFIHKDDGFPVYSPSRKAWPVTPSHVVGEFKSTPFANWHQTVLSRDEYFHLYPAPDADGWIEWRGGECPVGKDVLVVLKMRGGYLWKDGDPRMAGRMGWGHDGDDSDIIAYRLHKPTVEITCKSDHRTMEMPKPTIEQLAADYHARLAIAQQAQEEADSHRCGAEAALEKLVAAGKALGLVLSVSAPEPELVITDWRDLQVGDEVECVRTPGGATCKPGMVGLVTLVDAEGVEAAFEGAMPSRAKGAWFSAEGECFRFIRRPAKGVANV